MGRAFPMTGAIVNLICHLTTSYCDDSRRIPRTLVVGVCQHTDCLYFVIENLYKEMLEAFFMQNIDEDIIYVL